MRPAQLVRFVSAWRGRALIIGPDYCRHHDDRRHRLAGRDGAAILERERRMVSKDHIVMRRVASTIIERSIS
jgi:hypothetical protein